MTYARYRHIAIDNAIGAPTAQQIEEIEALLKARLPASFLAFLQVANGGSIEYVIDVPVGDGRTEPLSFSGFFSAEPGTFCDETLLGEIRSGREHARIPPGVLPFARDGGGSIVYLDLTEKGAGRVVAFVEGLPGWTGLRPDSEFIQLAASFDEYVDKLRIDRDAVVDHLQHDVSETAHVDAIEEWLAIGMPDWRGDPEMAELLDATRGRLSTAQPGPGV